MASAERGGWSFTMEHDVRHARSARRRRVAPLVVQRLVPIWLWVGVLSPHAALSLDSDCFDYAGSLHWMAGANINHPLTAVVNGNFAFVGEDSSLIGVDLTEATAPQIVTDIDLETPVVEMDWQGDRLYVPGDGAGLAIFDVSAPAAPVLLSWIDTPGAALDVAVRGNHAFVADFSGGIQVIDVADPSAPAIVATVATPGFAYDVMCLGSLLLVGHSHGFLVADVTNPLGPVVLGNLPTTDRVVGVDAAGDLAVAAADSSGLLVIDIGDPGAPTLRGAMATPEAAIEVTVHGDQAFLAVPWYGIQIVDIADPAQPTPLFWLGETYKPALSLVAEGRLYVADFSRGFQIFDLGERSLPPVLGSVPTLTAPYAMTMAGDRAYLATTSGTQGFLEIYDVASPTAPARLAATDAAANTRAIAVRGELAYLGAFGGIQVFDVTDPTQPELMSTLNVPRGAAALTPGPPGILFAVSYGEYSSAFYAVDVADPTTPEILGSLPLPWTGTNITYGLERVYVSGSWGLMVVDARRPDAPVLSGQLEMLSLRDVELALPENGLEQSPLAYLLGYRELFVADLSDPDWPAIVGRVPAPPVAATIARHGRHLYAGGSWSSGLTAYDVIVPERPLLIGGTAAEVNSGILAVHAGTGHVHVAGRLGLRILPRQCETPGPVVMTVSASGVAGGIAISWSPEDRGGFVALRILRSRAADAGYTPLTAEWLPTSGPGTYLDRSAEPGVAYFYRLEALDRTGVVTTFGPVSAAAGAPALLLGPPRPNPFQGRDRVEIDFALPERTMVRLDVIDAAGRLVRRLVSGEVEPGAHRIHWDGRNNQGQPVASGNYFLRLAAGARVVSEHLVRVR